MAVFGDQNKKTQEQDTSLFSEKDIERKRERKQPPPKVKSSFADISPFIDLTELDFYELSNADGLTTDGYLEVLQLTSKDVYALNQEDIDKDIIQFAYFNQWFVHDYKIVPLNFPEDTSEQQRQVLKGINNPVKQAYVPFLQQKLEELKFIESERTNREYFMLLYAEDEYTLLTRVKQVQGLLRNSFPAKRISMEKKMNIVYKLMNLNSKNKSVGGDE